ncbi:MAG TPA: hypothetical protein VI457_09485 [Methylococcaceae bacterium]|nr:hypothetical protein [Methylococcaceae bacterium]
MQRLFMLILSVLISYSAMAGETVYLCRQNGKVTYAASPRFGECQPVDLKVLHPSEEELERLAREKERREAEQQAAEEQGRQERQVRAQEEAARASKRQARAAEKEAEYEREQLRVQEDTYELEKYRQPLIFVPKRTFPRKPVSPPFPKLPGGRTGGSPPR